MHVPVSEVAAADTHIVIQRARNGDGDGDSKDGVRNGQGIEVAVAEKDETRGKAPDQGDRGENGVGQMRQREDQGSDECGEPGVWKEPKQTGEEKALEQELLRGGPKRVGPIGLDEEEGRGGNMHSAKTRGREDGQSSDEPCYADDPEGTKEVCQAQSHGLETVEGDRGEDDDGRRGEPPENSLRGTGCPADDEDQGVSADEFEEDAEFWPLRQNAVWFRG